MSDYVLQPPFGTADLSNCERELIHLAGSVQPHGVLLVVREPDLVVLQASGNADALLGVPHNEVLGRPLGTLGGDVAEQVARTARGSLLMLPCPTRCRTDADGVVRRWNALIHRHPRGTLVIELEPAAGDEAAEHALPLALTAAIGRITSAPSFTELGSEVVDLVRALTGYDRVMVYQFDADGHGEVISEAREERLEPFLGQRYPASDIPQRARELYLRTRVRVLVDVHYEPAPIVPRHSPHTGEELDMSLCHLRSMSPLHLQYLKNMGVTATLVTSLVRDGRLWGLIACHHYSAKSVPYETRAACELLSEVVSTRITALENRAQVEAELFVRDLEHRLVSSATDTGDWRDALFDEPNAALLQPVGATGAALFYEGEITTAGKVPSRPELRALAAWLAACPRGSVFHTAAFATVEPEFATLAGVATGVMAIELSHTDGEYLVWFRPEQVRTVTWAGAPHKPAAVGNDPRELSPRRSFAAWRELVRGTAAPWSSTDVAIAGAMRVSLVDVVLQMRALRALIADQQATSSRRVIDGADEPMILADGDGEILVVNEAFHHLIERPIGHLKRLDDMLLLAADAGRMRDALHCVSDGRQWRGELRLSRGRGQDVPVAVRADPVPGLRGGTLGYIIIFTDLRQQREAHAIRARLERTIAESTSSRAGAAPSPALGGVAAVMHHDFDELLAAVLANATAAITQLGESPAEPATGDLLRELEAATRRAADLTSQILSTVSKARRES